MGSCVHLLKERGTYFLAGYMWNFCEHAPPSTPPKKGTNTHTGNNNAIVSAHFHRKSRSYKKRLTSTDL